MTTQDTDTQRHPSIRVEASGRSSAAAWITFTRFAALLSFLLLSSFGQVIVGRGSFFYRDFALFGYPLAHYHRTLFWRGELPLWNPFNNCGLPFLAQWNTLTLYPGSLIYLLLPLPWSLNLFCLAHLAWAGMGMFLLVRRWTNEPLGAAVAGIAYAFNGLLLHALMWPNNIAALGWLPWVLLVSQRAWSSGGVRLPIASLVGALQMLTGAPEIILFTWIVLAVFWAVDLAKNPSFRLRMSGRFAVLALSVGALSAVQLLPFLDLVAHSQRSGQFARADWSMPAWGCANFLVPLFHCSKSLLGVYSQVAQQWTSSYYVGAGVIALAILALRHERRGLSVTLVGIAVFGILLALGENGPVLPALRTLFPQLGFARYPIKFVVLPVFAFPALAGLGVAWLSAQASNPAPPTPDRLRFVGAAWLTIALAITAILVFAAHRPALGEQPTITTFNGLPRLLFLTLTLVSLLAASQATRPALGRLCQLAAPVLVGFDLLTHAPSQNPTLPPEVLKPGAVDLGFMPKLGQGRAMISPRVQAFLGYAATADPFEFHRGHQRALFGDLNLLDEIPKVNGFYSLYPRDIAQLESALYRCGTPTPAGLLDFLGVVQISADQGWFDWIRHTNALPLLTAGQQPLFASSETALRAVLDSSFSGQQVVYLPEDARSSFASVHATATHVTVTRITAHLLEGTTDASDAAALVVAQSFYHNWRAFVDDQPVRIWPANVAFQALPLPPGRHRVRLEYHDQAFAIGLGISASALLVLLLAGFLSVQHRFRGHSQD